MSRTIGLLLSATNVAAARVAAAQVKYCMPKSLAGYAASAMHWKIYGLLHERLDLVPYGKRK